MQNKINELTLQRKSINNEYRSAVDKIKHNKVLTNAEKNEFQNKINELTLRINSVNNEHHRAVDKIKILKEQKKKKKKFGGKNQV